MTKHCFKIYRDNEEDHLKCWKNPLIIDACFQFNHFNYAEWSRLSRKDRFSTFFNERSKSQKHFQEYASDKLLQVICIFEAPIPVEPRPEICTKFSVIENERQSLLDRDSAVELKVLRLRTLTK